MKNLRIALFAVVAAVHLAVPAWMIARQVKTLTEGRVFKFRTAPVDPYDAFRGRFVALSFKISEAETEEKFERNQTAYVTLAEDPDGFAKVVRVTHERRSGDDVLRVQTGYSYEHYAHLDFPFTRYYLEEKTAPEAERAYREASRRDHENAWVTVRVRNGYGALEELWIDGKPVRDFLREQPAP
ncbi:MAG: hypothetical protein QOD99_1335 [Chthoniobacter sp.]|nr:hypothetical protein [Chthoniobacter sp.]